MTKFYLSQKYLTHTQTQRHANVHAYTNLPSLLAGSYSFINILPPAVSLALKKLNKQSNVQYLHYFRYIVQYDAFIQGKPRGENEGREGNVVLKTEINNINKLCDIRCLALL